MDTDGMVMTASTSGGKTVETCVAHLNSLLARCTGLLGSDLHLSPGLKPHLRIDGELNPLEDCPLLSALDTSLMARAVIECYVPSLTNYEELLFSKGSIDGAFSAPDGSRFRFNLFVCQRQVSLIFRRLEDRFRTLTELGMPEILYKFCDMRDGLVLISGPTGSGKSTTLAALLDRINRTRTGHVVTIEDPIEYVHRPVKCVISHRQVGIDAPSFSTALVSALRQDPDIILLGEARDLDTIRTAIVAAETGHLVFATLHAGDCIGGIERLIAVFSAAEQDGIRRQLALVLRAVIAQHLLPAAPGATVDGAKRIERVALSELLVVNAAVANLIAQGKTTQIASIMETGQSVGMQTMDWDLARLTFKGLITEDVAVSTSRSPSAMRELLAMMRKRTYSNQVRTVPGSGQFKSGSVLNG